jgi:hypothetical protein
MGSVDKTLFTLKHGTYFLLVQIYVHDTRFVDLLAPLYSDFKK